MTVDFIDSEFNYFKLVGIALEKYLALVLLHKITFCIAMDELDFTFLRIYSKLQQKYSKFRMPQKFLPDLTLIRGCASFLQI